MKTRSEVITTRETDYKVNHLTFADDILLLKNDSTQAQRQLDALELKARKAFLQINVQKNEQMSLNQSSILSPNDPLVIKGQQTSNISAPTLDRPNTMLKFGLDLHGQHLPNKNVDIKITEGQT